MKNGFTVEQEVKPLSPGKLDGYTVSLKDAIWVKGLESTASSAMLRSFIPVEHSTVAQKILEQGGTIIGKTVQDAFGFGTFSVNVGKGYTIPVNPVDAERCTGGSSGGAAVAAATIDHHIAISESTGGSIVTPAAFCGVVGLCPTYGRVSRYGLISYASSLDKIGTMAKNVKDAALGLEVISGLDTKDETSSAEEVPSFSFSSSGKKIGVLKYTGVDPVIQHRVDEIIEDLQQKGLEISQVELPFTQHYALSAYYVIAMSEASTHLACLSGLRYGASLDVTDVDYNDYFTSVRTENFNEETKRRILLGTFTRMSGYRGQYYVKALKVRKKIMNEYAKVFEKVDVLISPTVPRIAPKFSEIDSLSVKEQYLFDQISVGPNIAGLPHCSIPIQKEGMPFGIMVIGNYFDEESVLAVSQTIEEERK